MKNLFNLDNPFMQVLVRVADLVILNLLCLVCCIPVVTIGPALIALNKTAYDLTLERCTSVAATYFRAFGENFKQGMIAGIAATIALAALVCDYVLLRLYYEGNSFTILVIALGILLFLVLGLLSYLFPLIGRYSNTLPEHVKNAGILMIVNFPKTMEMVVLHLMPLLLLVFFPNVLLYTLIFWIFAGLSFFAQVDAWLLHPVFQNLEKEPDQEQ